MQRRIRIAAPAAAEARIVNAKNIVQGTARDGTLDMADAGSPTKDHLRRRRMEIFAFLFLTVVLMPAVAVATVGSYGLSVWIYQMIAGPPGPPSNQ